MSFTRLALSVFASSLLAVSSASAAGFTEFEDRPTKDGDNSEDDPLTAAAPVPWNLAPFATAFPGRATLIRGTLDARDVDAYAFSLTSGQLLLATLLETAEGERNDTSLGLFTGTTPPPLASDDDAASGFFSLLGLPVASTGVRRLSVTGFGDTSWNGTHNEAPAALVPYTLLVAAVSNPPPFQEVESNSTLGTATALPPVAGVVGGTLGANDVDYFKIDLEPGDRLAVSFFDLKLGLFELAEGERNDSQIALFTPNNALALGGQNDDGGPGMMSNLIYTVPAGQGGSWKVAFSGKGDAGFIGQHKEGPFSYLLAVARERACPNVTPLISAITVSTGKAYVTASLKGGDHYYIDRTAAGRHTLVDVPAAYECSQWIKTANDDALVSVASHLSFTLAQPSSVYVAFDTRSATEPSWLATGFTPTGEIADVADSDPTQELRLLRRDLPAGPVTLGGNRPSTASSHYLVFARPLDLADPLHAFVIPGLPEVVNVTISGVTLQVVRQPSQTAAQLAGSVAAAINANPTLIGLRIFGFATGTAFTTTGIIQSVSTQSVPIPALPYESVRQRLDVDPDLDRVTTAAEDHALDR